MYVFLTDKFKQITNRFLHFYLYWSLHPHVYKRSLFCHANIRNYSEEDFKLKFWRKYLGVAIYIRIGKSFRKVY